VGSILLDAAKYKLNSQLSASRCPNGYFKAVDSWNWNAAAAAAPFRNFDLFSFGWPGFTFTRRFAQAALFRYQNTQILRYTDTQTLLHAGEETSTRIDFPVFVFSTL